MDQSTIYLILAGVFGLFMAWGIGANDVANAMATSVGSKALRIGQAIVIAGVFEFAGAYLAGGEVTNTIRKGIVAPEAFTDPQLLIWGMLASLLAAGTWLAIASAKGWPVSTTHSIVGAVVGFAAVGVGVDAVAWGKVGKIVASWVVSPVIAGTLAFFVFRSIQNLIISTDTPLKNAIKYGPIYLFSVGFMISLVTLKKGLTHIGINFSEVECLAIAFGLGLTIAGLGAILIRRVKVNPDDSDGFHYESVEKIFAVMMIFTASAMAFAHGSNDVANAVGPMAAVISTAQTGLIQSESVMPAWVLLVGGIGIVIGLATLGYKVIMTVGQKITELTPTRGFSAEIAAASTVVFASYTGLPVSTTQVLVGAVLGVGFARGIGAIDLRVVGNIFMSWVITLPAGAFLSIVFFYLLKGVFS